MRWILPLHSSGNTLSVAGGKGANLARLAHGGWPVPGGFVVSTAAYRAYVAAYGLAPVIDRALAGLEADRSSLEEASATIRDAFAAGAMPPDLARALDIAYAELGSPPVAVRSSATAEDLPGFSFAGQQDTYLNVTGGEALIEAVTRCWSSLWTARAMGYRLRNTLADQDLALAVVVQEMVESEASGVLFTAAPLTGRRTEMVIEATLGLGEALVSGQVEPDRYGVDAATGRVLWRAVGAKALSIRSQPGGGTITQAERGGDQAAAPDEAIARLADLGRQVAEMFGSPQDVEWAWAGGQVWLLQSRPITSLYPLPAGMAADPLQILLSFGAVQGVLGPMTPLGRDAMQALMAGVARTFGEEVTADTQRLLYMAGERLFINLTGLIRHPTLRHVTRGALPMLDPGVVATLDTLWDDGRLAVRDESRASLFRRVAPVAWPAAARLVRTLLRPEAERARFEALIEGALAEFEARLGAAGSLGVQAALVEETIGGAFRFLLPQFVPRFGAAMGPLALLQRLAVEAGLGKETALLITRGVPHNVTTEMDLALWEAAEEIRAGGAAAHLLAEPAEALAAEYLAGHLPPVAQEAAGRFLAGYGMRGPGEVDLGRPRWREEPAPLFQALQGYLRIDDAGRAPDAVFRQGAQAAEAAVERLAAAVRQMRRGWLRAGLVRAAARRVRTLAGVRESPKFWAVRIMGLVRQALLAQGQELVEAGVLEAPDDLFFLRLSEIKMLAAGSPPPAGDWRALVGERRAAYAREEQRRQVPRLLLSDGEAFYEGVAATGEEAGTLAGSPVSPGVAEGAVRVVLDPHRAGLLPGEILVCPGTDPAWTPLFLVAAGLVMEVGGLMTHGSVVAREYGIPAVVGVSSATRRLHTGQRVRVDGTTGRVSLLEE
ncbi:MAG: phosphoenolpyruvate synthase [Anaerolineae bacterium]|nr:phosphoenolpyruvate synthase [Anaerolineae bacterium]